MPVLNRALLFAAAWAQRGFATQQCHDNTTDADVDDGVTVCANDGSDYTWEEITRKEVGLRVISTTHCPNHKYLALNPNFPVKGDEEYKIPLYPQYDSSVTVSLVAEGGIVGALFDGSMLYSPYGGLDYPDLNSSYANDYDNSAPAAEGWSFDMCGQHASSSTEASWHTHVPPSCLLDQLGQTETDHSPQIGWAFDGFPVYGPRGPNGVAMKRCTESTSDETYCTDDCGGYYDSGDVIGDGYKYRYYIQGHYNRNVGKCHFDFWADLDEATPNCDYKTSNEYYPFTPVCFHGCCPKGVACSSTLIPTCKDDDDEEDGYTDDLDDEAVTDELDYYDDVDVCTCDKNFPTHCTNYQEQESCNVDADCAYGLICGDDDLCAEPSPTSSPTPKPQPSPTTSPTPKPHTQLQDSFETETVDDDDDTTVIINNQKKKNTGYVSRNMFIILIILLFVTIITNVAAFLAFWFCYKKNQTPAKPIHTEYTTRNNLTKDADESP